MRSVLGVVIAQYPSVKFSFQNKVAHVLQCFSCGARFPAIVCVMLAAALLYSPAANASLSGDASITYADYHGSAEVRNSDGSAVRNSMSSSSLVQNYSLLYSSNGPIYNNRVGHYDVSLGYNWTALDTTFKSSTIQTENFNETRGHLLYKGEVDIDPKEVPFKLNAYSRDMTRNTITSSTGNGLQNFGSIFGYRDQAVGINDGLRMENGATLIAGVKNGMTNGYNEVLRHFPMILIDYKDTVNRDLRSVTPINDRLSRLAFVSLNKKENWFHYRHTLYEDYLKQENGYTENAVQLGTVDQYMSRRWIDFANWLRVSTDIQFSKRHNNYQTYTTEDLNLNLFVTGERKYWNARTFTTFNRYRDENNKLLYQATLPLYASGIFNQDVSWNVRSSIRDNHNIDAQGTRDKFTSMLAGYRVDAFKRDFFTLSQAFDVESSQTNTSNFVTLSGGLETTSTSRFSRKTSLSAAYNIKNSTTSTAGTDSSSNFMEQKLVLNGSYAPTNELRFVVNLDNSITKGNLVSFSGNTGNAETTLNQYVNPRNLSASEMGSQSIHSVSTLTVTWIPKPRLSAYLTFNEDVYKSSVLGVSPTTEVLAGASFTNDRWSVNDTFRFAHGNREIVDENSNSVSNGASVRYAHSRNLDAGASASYASTRSNGKSLHETELGQQVNYSYFTKTGISRKLLEFNETLTYADGSINSGREFRKNLMLGMKYYPISQLALIGSAGYSYTALVRDYTLVWNASAVANFRLLQASLDYSHGVRVSDRARENKITGNIRRSF